MRIVVVAGMDRYLETPSQFYFLATVAAVAAAAGEVLFLFRNRLTADIKRVQMKTAAAAAAAVAADGGGGDTVGACGSDCLLAAKRREVKRPHHYFSEQQ